MNTPRRHSHKRGFLAAIAVAIPAMLIGSGLSAPSAQAGYIVTLTETGGNVVANGSGPINLTGLSFVDNTTAFSGISPAGGVINTGAGIFGENDGEAVSAYKGFTGPSIFGSGTFIFASSGSGDMVLMQPNFLYVPQGYVSDSPLLDSATYDNQTLSSLGVTPGIYKWIWGSGPDQNFTLDVPAVVPAPLIGRGLPVLLAVGGLLFGAKLLERSKRHGLQSG